ncbi:D-inositol-3-phosphate+glycosyltransferase [Methylocapsa aurea]
MTGLAAVVGRLSRWRDIPFSLRYTGVSVICAVLNNMLLILLTAAGLDTLTAVLVNFAPMVIIGFVLQTSIAFEGALTPNAFLRYCGVMASNQPLWFGSLFLLCDIVKLPVAVAGPAATVGIFFWNYVATHWAMMGRVGSWRICGGKSVRHSEPLPGDDGRPPSVSRASGIEPNLRMANVALNAPRRIAFVCDAVMPWHKGGRETMLLQLSRRLCRPDQEVHIYTMNWWNGPKVIERDGVFYHAICGGHPLYKGERRSTEQAIRFSFGVFGLVFEPFDALHVDHIPFFPLYSARMVAWLKGKRLTATWHEVWGRKYWLKYMSGPAGMIGYLTEALSFMLPDAIVSDSQLTTKRLRDLGVRCPVETHPLGVDVEGIAAVPPGELESDVIYVGRLLGHKGVALLVRSVAAMKTIRPDIRVLIVGDGPEKARIKQLVSDLDLASNVTLLGQVEDTDRVHALMKSSKLLVLPSTREGFGLVVLEAHAAGLPVVTLRHEDNAAQELIREGVNGFLAMPEPDDLARKIEHALQTREQLRPLADIERYDWDFVARRLDRFLRGEAA